ncbi:hypothetical protein TTHERM_00470730 (macronuclear) [Tetrahymena thermophila SB210]|uniref:CS domain-containing protein n=1 Tax=Tetrahymena thermophila (strain SB210) TaxID=312017 RepID=I7MGL7_TETTS|nr:hypothetical protein TTHERM_00470730 [Tetrahymena thermophila SB210]EAR85300.1 hypothetical protein TTHERM_00470730 [Tetrahymena thermophila SB210]|eukprot:XP_001032963.1 hypothetical protein TTHERM_00470730 [Tetrahymena thermophila SB210]
MGFIASQIKKAVLAILILAQLLLGQECFSQVSIYTTEQEMKHKVDQFILSRVEIPMSCLQTLLDSGYYQTALYLFEEYFSQIPEKLEESFSLVKQKANNIKRDLDQLQINLMASNKEVQVVEPAFQWAQSKSHVFLQVKLAMRLDAPACLTCKEEIVKIENNTFYMSAFGIISHTPVRFKLNFSLCHPVSIVDSSWNYESVGTYFFSLAKMNNTQLWLNLEKDSNRKVQIWWDMREKHQNDMDDWGKMKEEEADNLEKQKREEKKKAKQEKKKARLEQNRIKKEAELERKKKEEEESWTGWFSKKIYGSD